MKQRAARIVGPGEAPDIVQNVLARLWARAREQVVFSPALLGAALRNAAIDQYRRERRYRALVLRVVPEQIAASPPDAERVLMAGDALHHLEGRQAALPERQRVVFLLNRTHGCSYDEIAAALEVSYSTAKREIARALQACRQALDMASRDHAAAP